MLKLPLVGNMAAQRKWTQPVAHLKLVLKMDADQVLEDRAEKEGLNDYLRYRMF